jgi:hypothetical protein
MGWEPPTDSQERRGWRAVTVLLAVAALWSALIIGIHRESPRTLVSAHGLLHTAIAQRFDPGAPLIIPPENPFFAGEPLAYYWFFHAAGAGVARVLGLDPLHAFELLIVAGTCAMVLFAGGLARSLYGSLGLGALISYLILAGANVQAPLVLTAKLLTRGTGILNDEGTYLWGLVHPLNGHMRLWDWYGMHGPLINFFFNVTARPLALSCLVLALWMLYRVLARGGATRMLALAASVALCSAFSSLIGIAAVLSLGAALLVLVGVRRTSAARLFADSEPRIGSALLAMGAGLLLGSLTFWHLFTLSGGQMSLAGEGLGGALWRLRTMIASAWLPIGLALWGVTRVGGNPRFFLATIVLATAGLITTTALVSLPVGNQDNFFHAGLVMLAIPASAGLLGPRGRVARLRALALVAVFLPTLLLVIFAYTNRPPVPISFQGVDLARSPADSDHARLYQWIQTSTAEDAVFVIDPGPPTRAMSGNTAELPALTRRMIFTEHVNHYIVSSHPDAGRRAAIVRSLLTGESLSPTDARYLSALGREVYLMLEDPAQMRVAPALQRLFGTPLFRSGPIAVFRWSDVAGAP